MEYVRSLLGFDLDLVMLVEMDGEKFRKLGNEKVGNRIDADSES